MAYLKEHEDHVRQSGGYRSSVLYMENADGRLMIEACTECDHVNVACEHVKNSWNVEGTQLTCDLCGIDGT